MHTPLVGAKAGQRRPYPTWGPDDPPPDAPERSFAWLAEFAYFEVNYRSSTENDQDEA